MKILASLALAAFALSTACASALADSYAETKCDAADDNQDYIVQATYCYVASQEFEHVALHDSGADHYTDLGLAALYLERAAEGNAETHNKPRAYIEFHEAADIMNEFPESRITEGRRQLIYRIRVHIRELGMG